MAGPAHSRSHALAPRGPGRAAARRAASRTLLLLATLLLGGASSAVAEHYVRYEHSGAVSWGVIDGDHVRELDAAPWSGGEPTGRVVAKSEARLLAPVEPSKVIAVGLNYRSHLGGAAPAAEPGLFAKLPTSIVGPGAAIVLPADSRNVHYEAELVLVIGRRASHVPEAEALDYVFGVTAGNDVSERGWQRGDLQWFRAKASDSFGPVGPVVATGLDPGNLLVEGRLNGETRQKERSSDLLFGPAAIVAYVSRYVTLLPGDVIFTGTPGSTAAMKPGDVFEVEVEGVGVLRNPVTAAGADTR